MFTGIIRAIGRVTDIKSLPGLTQFAVTTDNGCLESVQKGASVAIDGVCLTAVSMRGATVWFDAIAETLQRTTLKSLAIGDTVNVERAARFGDEIGGHLLSGHIYGTVTVKSIEKLENNCVVAFLCPPEWMKYILPKGYVALNGASLTIVDVDRKNHIFTVHLIPETLNQTTFGATQPGDQVNLEIDSQTQTIVDTLERIYASKSTS